MNDEETVALIAGGHSFGKTHGAGDPSFVGPEPEGAQIRRIRVSGWRSKFGKGHGADAITGGPEVTWSQDAHAMEQPLLRKTRSNSNGSWRRASRPVRSSGGRKGGGSHLIPDAHDKSKKHVPTMLTTDLALRMDPAYEKISRRFLEHPDQFADAFARAWFKLTHRDMGPKVLYLGPEVPKEDLIWQDPIPQGAHPSLSDSDASHR